VVGRAAYLPGLEGIALLDARAEDHDRAFAGTRLSKIRRPLAGKKPRDRSEFAERASTVTAYKQQSASYDAETGAGCSLPKSRVPQVQTSKRSGSSAATAPW
jgi:hypothetical protein